MPTVRKVKAMASGSHYSDYVKKKRREDDKQKEKRMKMRDRLTKAEMEKRKRELEKEKVLKSSHLTLSKVAKR